MKRDTANSNAIKPLLIILIIAVAAFALKLYVHDVRLQRHRALQNNYTIAAAKQRLLVYEVRYFYTQTSKVLSPSDRPDQKVFDDTYRLDDRSLRFRMTDPWGHHFIYRLVPSDPEREFEIVCSGPDGWLGTP